MLVQLVCRPEANRGNPTVHESAAGSFGHVTIADIIEHTMSTRRLHHRSHARKAAVRRNENCIRNSKYTDLPTYDTQALHESDKLWLEQFSSILT